LEEPIGSSASLVATGSFRFLSFFRKSSNMTNVYTLHLYNSYSMDISTDKTRASDVIKIGLNEFKSYYGTNIYDYDDYMIYQNYEINGHIYWRIIEHYDELINNQNYIIDLPCKSCINELDHGHDHPDILY